MYLTDGPQTMFTLLRQRMALLSTLAYNEPSLPRFMWDVNQSTLTIDGVPVTLQQFKSGILQIINECHETIPVICGSLDVTEFWSHIESKMDLLDRENCFFDNPFEVAVGTSVLSDPRNGMARFRHILLEHILRDSTYCISDEKGDLITNKSESRQLFVRDPCLFV